MELQTRGRVWPEILLVLLVMSFASAYCIATGSATGMTWDEWYYTQAGLDGWRDGEIYRLMVTGTMPLAIDVQTLPLYWLERYSGERWPNDPSVLLRPARAASLVFVWIMLGAGYGLGWHYAGRLGGRLALGLLATDPTLLGNASLAATDFPLAAMLVLFVFTVVSGRRAGFVRRIVLPGVAFGLAILAKGSALLYGTAIVVLLEAIHQWAKPGAIVRRVLSATLYLLAIGVLGVGVAVYYCGFDEKPQKLLANMSRDLPANDPWKPTYAGVSQWPMVPHIAAPILFQMRQNDNGRGCSLWGRWHAKGVWYYFPAVLAIKLPALVWLLGVALFFRRPRAILNPMILCAILVLLASLVSSIQLGVRIVLPALSLGLIGLAVGVARTQKRCWRWLGVATIVSLIAVNLWIYPNALSFANQFVGGVRRAPDRFSDSNVDWGQGLPQLDRWHAANQRPALAVWYYGSDPLIAKLPVRHFKLEQIPLTTEAELLANLGPTFLAVGVSNIYQMPDESPTKELVLTWLRRQTPVAQVGTFRIYDVRFAK